MTEGYAIQRSIRYYYSVSKDEIKDIKAVMTFMGGRIVYEKKDS